MFGNRNISGLQVAEDLSSDSPSEFKICWTLENFEGTFVRADERVLAVQLSQVQCSLLSKVCLIDSQSCKFDETFDFESEVLLQTGIKR